MYKAIALGGAIVLLLLLGSLGTRTLQGDDGSIVSRAGLHAHPTIEIYVKGERIGIPENVGVGPQYAGLPTYDTQMKMTAIHTHDDLPIIHLEFQGVVREEDLRLGSFFKIWGHDMREFGENMRMTVNGIQSLELEGYIMRDGDRIRIDYD
jgi:hypothetical protein